MQIDARRSSLAQFEEFVLDLRTGELRHGTGKVIRLPEQPFQILVMLLERPGEVVGREELRKRLWPNDTVVEFEHSISAAMNRLRQALGDSANNPTYIETLARRGYRWLCAVEHLENPAVASRLLERDAAGPLSDISAMSTIETSGEEVLPNRSRNPIAWIVAAVLALALGGLALVHFREPVPRHQRIRFQMNQPEGQLCLIQLSPDGRFLAVATLEETYKFWMRPLEAVDTRLLTAVPFDMNGLAMFWSWDGDHLVYHSAGKLYKIALDGTPPVVLRDSIPSVNSGAWIDRDVILLGTNNGLFRLDPSGGPAVKLDDHLSWSPSPLPGNRYLYVRQDGIFAGSLNGGKPIRILADTVAPAYVSGSSSGSEGYLLFERKHTLVAQSFNAKELQLRGEAITVEPQVGRLVGPGMGAFAASKNGTLAFGHGDAVNEVLTWVDRTGRKLQRVSKPFDLVANPTIRLSPDDSKAIIPIDNDRKDDLWIADLKRDTLTRFTYEGSESGIWSPDGRNVLWGSNDGKKHLRPADGSGKDEVVFQNPTGGSGVAYDWSSDGKLITFCDIGEKNVLDIWLAPTRGHRRLYPYTEGSTYSAWAQFSPDGRWMAYVGEQFPRAQVFVESVPRGKGRWQISTEGGDWPIWRRDGKELFYRKGTQIMAVPIQLSATSVKSGAPEALFDVPINTRFQVSRDGQRFLIAVPADNSGTLTMDTDWKAGLPQLK